MFDHLRLYGYNLRGEAVPFPVDGLGNNKKSLGHYVIGVDADNNVFMVNRTGEITAYPDGEAVLRWIHLNDYKEFKFDPFSLSFFAWEELTTQK